jgi:hypothetical protein
VVLRGGFEVGWVVATQDSVAMGVIPGSLLRVRQNLVGGVDFGELAGSIVDIAEIAVRM